MGNSETTIYEGTSPGTKKSLSRLLGNARALPFVFRNNVSSFSQRNTETICLLPANLATPGNTIRNNVSATMFPSLARP